MDYFKKLSDQLNLEKNEDKLQFELLKATASIKERRANGLTWYPVAIRGTEMTKGDYITVELERTTNQDIFHQFRSGVPAVFFSNHSDDKDKIEGTITHQNGNKLKINLRTEELPEWANDGKLGVEVLFDNNSYSEMFNAIKSAEKAEDNKLVSVLIGQNKPVFKSENYQVNNKKLNDYQIEAINKILNTEDVVVVHGPPGTGKTTTIIEAIKQLVNIKKEKILVVAPSNTAVDLLTEKLYAEGINVLRVGNPVRVSESLLALTLDAKVQEHPQHKEAKKWKKQAQEFKNMAHKYKKHFGHSEREQRKALFDEAHKLMKDVEKTEQYIIENLTETAQVITSTLIGANHYTLENLKYDTVIIDEAGQGLEPACWVSILKGSKLVLAGDHCQLPPTIKSNAALKEGLAETLLEKIVKLHPEAVSLLETQYRMNEKIMGHSSNVFYNNRLKAHESVANHTILDFPALKFIDTAGCGYEEKLNGTSSTNPEEAAFLIKQVENFIINLENSKIEKPTIAIISPYKGQVTILNESMLKSEVLKSYKPEISINTIDSFQGQERDAVFIGMVRSNIEGEIGFLGDIRRMNVAMTRARKMLIVIGDSATIGNHKFYSEFISYAESVDGYQSAWELMYD
jgi:ATP-dependent RNA/DNA helicase IGHMBP2